MNVGDLVLLGRAKQAEARAAQAGFLLADLVAVVERHLAFVEDEGGKWCRLCGRGRAEEHADSCDLGRVVRAIAEASKR